MAVVFLGSPQGDGGDGGVAAGPFPCGREGAGSPDARTGRLVLGRSFRQPVSSSSRPASPFLLLSVHGLAKRCRSLLGVSVCPRPAAY